MSFWRRTPAASAAPALAPEPPPAPEPQPYRSWALTDLLARRAGDRRWRVLDLGTANNVNLTFFIQHGASYQVEELYGTIASCRVGGRLDAAAMRRLPDLMAYPEDTRFDAVFAWDLLDFVGPAGAAVIGERLAPFCHPRTLVHATVTRDGRLPAHPARWEIGDEETIRTLPVGPAVLASPRYTDASLQRSLGTLEVHKSYLLKNGLQEYLLAPVGAVARRAPPQAGRGRR